MIDRRTLLLTSMSAAIASLIAPKGSRAANYVRYNVASDKGKEMLKIYTSAVQEMKSWKDSDPRSWTFQWYIHASPASKDTEIKKVFGTSSSKEKALAEASWYTCQPHAPQANGTKTQPDYFLPWHRLYVLQLENIVRQVTQNDAFTLPYWDYTNAKYYAIPEEFRDPSSPLYKQNRNINNGKGYANVNGGQPINQYYLDNNLPNPLALPVMQGNEYTDFCSTLNGNLHNHVHDLTGNSNNMGYVPTAAGDPVFWMHHCNIDRIWSNWNALGGENPNKTVDPKTKEVIDWSTVKFTFVAPDGTALVADLSSVSNPATLPYSYDSLPQPVSANVKLVADSAAAASPLTLMSSAPSHSEQTQAMKMDSHALIKLGQTATTVTLTSAAANKAENKNRRTALKAGPQKGRIYVVLKSVMVASNPNTSYMINLTLAGQKDRRFVGYLNFFAATHAGPDATHGDSSVLFDITDLVPKTDLDGLTLQDATITLEPIGEPEAGSDPTIMGGIELQIR
ncbi:tyrosinase family protein [Agrobacterium vitis]|uniref:tyrosinase family protein n=1 Tax=Agrobacterium vitis TaxID=373 RepID=UPI0012E7C635|nr:tyrosinase family protein [Agrobacterium vitis]MVA26669.1 hypothetical protein [Agrobacterium vitis]